MDEYDELTVIALRARRGDPAAAVAFVRETQAEVWRLCAHLGRGMDADDLTQDTYARAFSSLHRFLGRSSARTWLLSIARRVCADAIRSAQRDRRRPVTQVRPIEDPAGAVAARTLVG
ncbi:MAG TPA: sigma-70 family RNA polymerase sigma factor, partial [Micromonosporaceae bacterium]